MLRSGTGVDLRRLFSIACVLLPSLIVYAILYRFAVAIPCLDDSNAVLSFLLVQHAATTTGAKVLNVIAYQHAEYKLIFEHALFAAWYGMRGSFSFRVFLTLGNLLPLVLLWALWRITRKETTAAVRLWRFVPVSFLVFQLTYAELLNWTMASLSALAVVVFSVAALAFLFEHGRRSLALALGFALLACGSSPNGFLLAPAGLLGLFLAGRWRRMLLWLLPFAVVVPAYLFGYSRVAHEARAAPAEQVRFLLSFLGGTVENMHGAPVRDGSVVVGLLLLAVFAHAVRTRWWRRAPGPCAVGLWVLLTAALVATVRSSISVTQALSGRYKIYSALLLIVSYLYLLDRIRHAETGAFLRRRQRGVMVAVAAAAMLFSLAGDVLGARFLARREAYLTEGMRRYLADPAHTSPLYVPDDPQDFSESDRVAERDVLTAAIRAGIYRVPPLPPASREGVR